MIKAYNHSNLVLKHGIAKSLAVKGLSTAVQLYSFNDGSVTINLDTYTVGQYQIQYLNSSDEVIQADTLIVEQNLKYAPATYDGRSYNKIALQAIIAFMQGRATAQQRKVKVGDKQIEYSSFDQLKKWKDYFEKEVRKQQGKCTKIKNQKLFYRGL